jgi:hypothetical protein
VSKISINTGFSKMRRGQQFLKSFYKAQSILRNKKGNTFFNGFDICRIFQGSEFFPIKGITATIDKYFRSDLPNISF